MGINFESEYEFKIYHSLKIIRQFDWLLNSFVLDFFVDDHWNQLPPSWREAFENMEPSDLGEILTGGKPKIKVVLPLSVLALLRSIKYLSISREKSANIMKIKNSKTVTVEGEEMCDMHPSLVKLFSKNVKSKKRHEILLISELVAGVAEEERCCSVVDIGSGLGHLVRALSYRYNLNAVGIEGQNKLTLGARDLDNEFESFILKHPQKGSILKFGKPQHMNLMLTPEIQGSVLSESLAKYIGENGFGIVGLHPCGDLGPLLLRMFTETPGIKFICIVGCCFNKLSCQGDKFRGYPLSNFVSNIENNELSYESRQIACHAIESYCQRLVKGLYEDLQVHTYRALLEKILVTKWPNMKHMGLRSIKHTNTLTFQRYCEIATERIGVTLSEEDTSTEFIDNSLKMWKKIVILYTLRLILGPLVESIILWDRVLSLREKGAACDVHALFDPLISPRNHILIARKIVKKNNIMK